MNDLSVSARHALDFAAFLCAGVAAVSWANAAFVMSILAATVTFIMGGIRLYDRIWHGSWNGPQRRGE